MKRLLTLFICIGAAWPMFSYAQTEGGDKSESWEVRESDLETYEVKAENTQETVPLADEEILTKKGTKFTLYADQIEPASIERFHEMSEDKQKSFHQARLRILSRMAAILNSQRLTIGFGMATKNKLTGMFKKRETSLENSEQQAVPPKVALREMALVPIEKILNNINNMFWREASKVGDAKEVTLYLNPAGQAVLLLPSVKVGGALGLMLGVGYNKDTDVLFLDVMATIEKAQSGFAALVAVKLLVGLEFDTRPEQTRLFKARRGEVYYPMFVPFWDGTGPNHYTAGVSLVASLPPPPFSNPFHFRTDFRKILIARLGISTAPLWNMVYQSLKRIPVSEKLLTHFEQKARIGVFANSCPRLFAF